ncbi:MAG: hypothetical protein RPU90_04345 [Candidatus Sedimenticola sp. (ex Thyasira tokunagai)]
MKVKIGNNVYDGNEQPVMVILTDQDKENIKNMAPESPKYATFPDEWGSKDEMLNWMGEA